ncbi:MAG: T9SS type A sorting domain-containing protein [Chitinophagales bacterium]|nr:T9SS type A sorting domain-containing protein [Chitinophagaceae bacterium]MCB9066154.1 T9SS type A sorting domain-containing protein [Chitinophagales bacterium]
MKQLFTLLIATFILSLSANAQRYTLDSFDVRTGLGPSNPSMFTPFGNKLYFFATDIVNFDVMFETDGVTAPSLVGNPSSTPKSGNNAVGKAAVELGGIMYYSASLSATGRELYKYDGVSQQVLELDVEPGTTGSNPQNLTVFNNKIYFTTKVSGIVGIMEYDPNTKILRKLTDKYPDTLTDEFYHNAAGFFVVGNKLCFTAKTSANGTELFEYDTIADTIRLVSDINTGTASSLPHALHVYANKLYFAAIDSAYGCELWSYDGSNAPTRLTDIQPGKHFGIPYNATSTRVQIIGYNGNLYFSALSDTTVNPKPMLYRHEIATSNTTLVYDNKNGIGNQGPAINFIIYGNDLFYQDKYLYYGAIWTYDGTDTPRVIKFNNGNTVTRSFYEPTIFNKSIYFRSESTAKGIELYKFTDSVVGIDDVKASSLTSIVAYPNPTTDNVQLSFFVKQPMALSVNITNIKGEVVYTKLRQRYSGGRNMISIPMSELPAGMYIYSIVNDGTVLNIGKIMMQ